MVVGSEYKSRATKLRKAPKFGENVREFLPSYECFAYITCQKVLR